MCKPYLNLSMKSSYSAAMTKKTPASAPVRAGRPPAGGRTALPFDTTISFTWYLKEKKRLLRLAAKRKVSRAEIERQAMSIGMVILERES